MLVFINEHIVFGSSMPSRDGTTIAILIMIVAILIGVALYTASARSVARPTDEIASSGLPISTNAGPSVAQVIVAVGASTNSSASSYLPATIRLVIGVNNTVTWTNGDSAEHSITADGGSFDSGGLKPGRTFTHTFDKTGTYAYHCTFHVWMRGTVVVR